MSCHRVTAAGVNSRVGQRIPSARAAAGIRLEALDEFVSLQAVEEGVRSCGRLDRRWCASLPASAVVYFVLAMCLHFSESYAEILRKLTDGLRGAVHAGALRVAGTSAVSKARTQLGSEPLKALFELVRGPLTTPQSPGAFAFGRRLLMLSLDGTVLDVAPTQANTKAFGPPPGGSRKPGHHPQVKLVLLIACGTCGILGARFGPRRDNEVTLAKHLATSPTLPGGQLVLMDRAFHGHDILARITDCGATSSSGPMPTTGCPTCANSRTEASCPASRTGLPASARPPPDSATGACPRTTHMVSRYGSWTPTSLPPPNTDRPAPAPCA
ncbi:transposase domain-containing protein [Streptomyces mirabilis]|uniref:transposase domain-containing protein n=1 Tax=Streptomyces mirabilis TaxID=68239 RepID=UPI0036B042DA